MTTTVIGLSADRLSYTRSTHELLAGLPCP
jgi:hypothetical protein